MNQAQWSQFCTPSQPVYTDARKAPGFTHAEAIRLQFLNRADSATSMKIFGRAVDGKYEHTPMNIALEYTVLLYKFILTLALDKIS